MEMDSGGRHVDTHPVRQALIEAIKEALSGRPQSLVAEILDLHESQATRILKGRRALTVDEVVKLEKGLGLPPGELLARAGVAVPLDGSLREMLRHDPALSVYERGIVVSFYDSAVVRSAARRAAVERDAET